MKVILTVVLLYANGTFGGWAQVVDDQETCKILAENFLAAVAEREDAQGMATCVNDTDAWAPPSQEAGNE